ncbi:gigaxonin [Cocos nucifera]|uniref:Gigaxonin n=1 Tax=Cocos nucifera TaxID=13894 RepID=A0A8K0I672_COCNU|nr:gigaxonin [Cocos nucifera]
MAAVVRIYTLSCPRDRADGLSNWLESYDPSDNTWQRTGPIPGIPENHVLKGSAMVSIGSSLYIIGGRLCHKGPCISGTGDSIEVDVAVRRDVLHHDAVTGEWSACAPLLVPRFDFACMACDGKIYAAGGQCVLSSARGTSAAEVYNPTQDRWDPLPPMSTLRYKCVGVTWQGRFHVVGGFAEREISAGGIVLSVVDRSSAEVFDARRGEWDLVPGMWQLDVPPNQIVTVEGRLFSSGDCLNTWKGHIEAYDGKLNIWNIVERSQLHDPSSLVVGGDMDGGPAVQRLYLTMAPIGTQLYFLAGYRMPGDEFRSVSVVHTFDTASGSGEAWRSSGPMEVDEAKELCSHCCAVQLS